MYQSFYFQLEADAILLELSWKIFDEDFIIYAFCVLNIEIYLKLPRLKIRFQIKFIASPDTI